MSLTVAKARVKNAVTFDIATGKWAVGAAVDGYQTIFEAYGSEERALAWIVATDGSCWTLAIVMTDGDDVWVEAAVDSNGTWSDEQAGTISVGPSLITQPFCGFIGYESVSATNGTATLINYSGAFDDPLGKLDAGIYDLPAWARAVRAHVRAQCTSAGDATYFAAQIDWDEDGSVIDYMAVDVADSDTLYLSTPIMQVTNEMDTFAVRVSHDATTSRVIAVNVSLELWPG